MPDHHITLQHTFRAPAATVFDYFGDHATFGNVFGATMHRIREGDGDPNGVGSVRSIQAGPIRFEETIVTFERPKLIEYVISKGSPLKNHHGRIEFRAEGDTTQLHYTIEFDGRLPLIGGLIARKLVRDFNSHIGTVAATIEAQA